MDKYATGERREWGEWLSLQEISPEYNRIKKEEYNLYGINSWQWPEDKEMYNSALNILDIAKLNLTPRSSNGVYNDYTAKYVPLSVGGHTNLYSCTMIEYYKYIYGTKIDTVEHRYDYLPLIESDHRHDQPEAITGDRADDGTRDERLKNKIEEEYLKECLNRLPNRDRHHGLIVNRLLSDMRCHGTSIIGDIKYATDKAVAPINMLVCDRLYFPYLIKPDNPRLTPQDLEEIKYCEYCHEGSYYASEMWTVDYLKLRQHAKYDYYGYCTALLVMCTLLVNDNHWYSWREADYAASQN